MKKRILSIVVICSLFFLSSCIKKAIENTVDSVECAAKLTTLNLTESEDRTCAQIIADIEEVERDCAEFIDDDLRESFATARENCANN